MTSSMETQSTGSTPASRTAALTMFEGNVPCVFQLEDPSCQAPAKWLCWMVHEESSGCGTNEPALLCDEHKKLVQTVSHPFWRTWHNAEPVPCGGCGGPLRVERFEAI